MLGARGTEQHRIRAGILFLSFGIILLVWAWGSWIYRTSATGAGTVGSEAVPAPLDGAPGGSAEGARNPDATGVAKALPTFLGVGFLLVVVFFIGSFVIVRTLRKYREDLERKSPPPTDSEDVWSMHRISEQDDEPAQDDDEDEALTA